jgi:hypothetical protein
MKKALLLNGPRHLTTLRLGDNAPLTIVIPVPIPVNMISAFAMNKPLEPEFNTVLYVRLGSAPVAGFYLYAEQKDGLPCG